MANILLGATGSVAAVRVPALFDALAADGHSVKVVATNAATYFFDPASIGGSTGTPSPAEHSKSVRRPLPLEGERRPPTLVGLQPGGAGATASPPRGGGAGGEAQPNPPGEGVLARPRDPDLVILDEDEWPGREAGRRYERDQPVLHIELRKWAELFVIAPLDANTLAKLAVGLCDNCLTCIWRAWDPARPVVLAPAMNTLMWEHPFTRRHLQAVAAAAGAGHIPGHLDTEQLIAQINARSKTLRVVPPVEKRLACGDVGVGGLAEVADLAAAVREMLGR